MSGPTTGEVWILDLLRLFAWDDCESLWWRVNADGLRMAVRCNDTFYWATADAEEVTAADLPDLARAKADLPEDDWPTLWVARKRQMRPMRAYYKSVTPELAALFDVSGPERDPKDEG